jgi:MEDS: MEthanogen/methylotroph, DcmR Sensory domain
MASVSTANTNSVTLPSIDQMHSGEHICGMYRTDADQRELVVDYIRRGLENNEKIIYLVNVQTAVQLKSTFAAAHLDIDGPLARGQLVILTAKDTYLKGGRFDPDRMIALLRSETEKALAEGYTALRGTGEMTWALAGEPGSERLIEYESMLNTAFPHPKCYALCQYDRRRFDAELLLDVLHTHPKVLVDKQGFDNSEMYFVPQEGFLGADRLSATLDRWLHNLSRQHGRD